METSEPSSGGIASVLTTVRSLPVWMLAGLAAACFGVLYLHPFAGIDPTAFRAKWGAWIWVAAIACSALAITRAIDTAVNAYRNRRNDLANSVPLRVFPEPQRCWWHHAKQQDDSFISQLSFDIVVSNVADRPIRLLQVRLIKPRMRGEVVHSDISFPVPGTHYHSDKQPVPAHETLNGRLHMMIRGSIAQQGHPVRVALELRDQYGTRYPLKLLLPTTDSRIPTRPMKERLAGLFKKKSSTAAPLPAIWSHTGTYGDIETILNEERRAYAARATIFVSAMSTASVTVPLGRCQHIRVPTAFTES